MLELNNTKIIIECIEKLVIIFFTQMTVFKILNENNILARKKLIGYIGLILISIIVQFVNYQVNFISGILILIFLLSCLSTLITKRNLGTNILIVTISLAVNYAFLFIAIIIVFSINSKIVSISSDIINFGMIILLQSVMLWLILKSKRLKYGIISLQNNINNDYVELIILSISIGILYMGMIIYDMQAFVVKDIICIFAIFAALMFITIQKSLQLYYKQKMLIKELDETKEDLARAENKIKILERENIEESKKRHTVIHKQKSLEYKIEEMLTKTEMSTEEAAEVKERLEKLNKEIYTEKEVMELDKTGINSIDDMLKYMQSECVKNKIDFTLQIKGNIHYMVHNLVKEEELETLLADHIKDAIIAINHTNNANRSILVRLGNIDDIYSLYIYDSGVEFKPEVLESLGKKPCTTYANEGGTGMGFMNTFDTVRKHKASLIIEEIGKPVKDNYTKVIIIKFDKKNEFKVKSYHEIEKV